MYTNEKADFQVILYENDNSIKFNYKGVKAAPDNMNFAGIENKTGTSGLTYMGLSSVQSTTDLSVRFYRGTTGSAEPDNDGDNYTVSDGDCNDYDASIYPGAPEICDGKDNNCNGSIDEGCATAEPDNDGDNYTVSDGDCNDYDATIYPGAPEICDGKDNDCDGFTDEGCEADVITPLTLYFPLLSRAAEKTYFGLVNSSETDHLVGSLMAYNEAGTLLEEYGQVDLLPREQREFQLQEVFSDVDSEVGYVAFVAGLESIGQGYCRLIDSSGVRAASYPAAIAKKDSREIDIPNLMYGSGWKTELAVLSLSKKPLKVVVKFNNGAYVIVTTEANNKGGGLFKLEISEELKVIYENDEVSLGELSTVATAATVQFSTIIGTLDVNQDLAVAAVLYRNESIMSSALLQRADGGSLYAPYIIADSPWWTGLALYNPSSDLRSTGACTLAITATSLDEEGQKFSAGDETDELSLAEGEFKRMNAETFPEGTHGLEIYSDCGVSGMEFMGVETGGMGCLSLAGNTSKAGVFVHLQAGVKDNKWSGIALLNTDSQNVATVTLRAYNEDGDFLAKKEYTITALKQLVGLPESLFDEDVSDVASIRFAADRELTGLVVYSFISMEDGENQSQVEILPVLPIDATVAEN